jgi:hypothetical protein
MSLVLIQVIKPEDIINILYVSNSNGASRIGWIFKTWRWEMGLMYIDV